MVAIDKNIKIGLLCLLLFSGVLMIATIFNSSGSVSAEDLNIYSTNVSAQTTQCILLGENNLGKVEKLGPYGNTSSKVKIAYIIGVHPLEYKSHKALYASIVSKSKSLKYCYYIYRVTVTKDAKDYKKGRNNGQYLARDFVVPEIKKQKYNLVIDVHSNRGNYKKKRFVFAALQGKNSKKLALKISSKLKWLSYHYPQPQTSPKYVTNPLIRAGIKTIVYETYMYQSYALTKKQALAFIKVVDTMKL